MRDEVLGQGVQQCRIHGRIRRPNVIYGIDNPSSKKVTPHPIHRRLREHRIRTRCQPIRKGFPPLPGIEIVFRQRRRSRRRHQVFRHHHPAILRVLHLEIRALVVNNLFTNLVTRPHADPREKRRHLVVLILRPLLKRVIMALRTHHPRPHKDLRGLLHRRLGVTRRPVEIRLRGLVARPARRNQFPHPSVIRLVRRQRFVDPLPKSVSALLAKKLAARLE